MARLNVPPPARAARLPPIPRPRRSLRGPEARRAAAALFAVLVLAAALLFGAVDRGVQIGLLIGLAIGCYLHPPELRRPGLWGWLMLACVAFTILSQFLPAHWFGRAEWRLILSRDYGVAFPGTRNPEPGRAVDCILDGAIAALWFFWVRTLAVEHGTRQFLAWALFAAAAIVAAVSLYLGTRGDYFIYGIRYTPGWTGFGPFPNRNHTAALLAMGALAGAGCLVRAARRFQWGWLGLAILLEVATLLALITSKSRGGLLGFCCGAALFAALVIARLRSRSAVAGSVAGGLLCSALVLSFGSKVLSRFQNGGVDGDIPNNLRWDIWLDALRVWRDAPLFGHGFATFPGIFPIYQSFATGGQAVLHPESSWLLWLDELGAVPVGIAAALLIGFIARNAIDAVRAGERGFFIRAGAISGCLALLCHSLWDVPSHRWGTAAFGLALLAVACPPFQRPVTRRPRALWAAVPVVIAAFWLLPWLGAAPSWSPDAEARLMALLNTSPMAVSLAELRRIEALFPLDANLHEQIGVREFSAVRRPASAWGEFRIADRLDPSSWAMPAMQGWLSRDASQGISFHFWTMAVERGGPRAAELYMAAYRDCLALPGGEAYWHDYAEEHPQFLLCYANAAPSDDIGRTAFAHWWQARGDTGETVEQWELPGFYSALRRWGNRAQLAKWMARRPGLAATDFAFWGLILHDWQLDPEAWAVLAAHIPDPPFPPPSPLDGPDALEAAYFARPADPISAQAYARQLYVNGRASKAEQVILAVATGPNPPPWFIQKAAHLYAARKDYTTAVTFLLRAASGSQ